MYNIMLNLGKNVTFEYDRRIGLYNNKNCRTYLPLAVKSWTAVN